MTNHYVFYNFRQWYVLNTKNYILNNSDHLLSLHPYRTLLARPVREKPPRTRRKQFITHAITVACFLQHRDEGDQDRIKQGGRSVILCLRGDECGGRKRLIVDATPGCFV